MIKCSLNSCVIAVSGGIDSSVVLGIVNEAFKMEKSPIKRIEAISIPCNTDGATNQNIAYEKALSVFYYFNIFH